MMVLIRDAPIRHSPYRRLTIGRLPINTNSYKNLTFLPFEIEYIGWNDVTYLWSQYDRHFVRQHRRTARSQVVKMCRVIRIKLNQLV